MTIRLNHTFVHARDARRAARDLADTLGLPEPSWSGPFPAVRLGDGVLLEFVQVDGEVTVQHYAFEVADADFEAILARLRQAGRSHWAGPLHHGPGAVNGWGGRRGFYFDSLDGHAVEVLTRPTGPARAPDGGAGSPAQLVELVAHAYNTGDADAALRLFEPAAVLATQPGETATGDTLHRSIAGFLGQVRSIDIRVRHVYEADGVALLVTDHVTELVRPGDAPVRVSGTATDVARRGRDGRWRYLIDNPSGTGH
jgi:ketosteroid isomerase-like protein